MARVMSPIIVEKLECQRHGIIGMSYATYRLTYVTDRGVSVSFYRVKSRFRVCLDRRATVPLMGSPSKGAGFYLGFTFMGSASPLT